MYRLPTVTSYTPSSSWAGLILPQRARAVIWDVGSLPEEKLGGEPTPPSDVNNEKESAGGARDVQRLRTARPNDDLDVEHTGLVTSHLPVLFLRQ